MPQTVRTSRRGIGSGDHRRGPARIQLVEELGVVLDGLAAGRVCRLARVPEVEQPDEALVGRQADGAHARRRCAARRGCASSPRGRARARRAGRCRRPRRRRACPPRPARSSPVCRTEQTTSVGARSSFAAATRAQLRRVGAGRRLGRAELPRRLLQPLERLRADHAEPPRVREVVVRRPARQLQQLLERPPLDRPCRRRP